MWDIRRQINVAYLPDEKTVIQFDLEDAPKEMRRWWIVVENGEKDLCQRDPGFEVSLFVSSDVPTLSRVWIGQLNLGREIEEESIYLAGDKRLRESINDWFPLAKINEIGKEIGPLLESISQQMN